MIHPRGWMMGLTLLTERHAKQIAGVLSCYDRVIVQGTLPAFCYADGMTAYLCKRRIRIFDFLRFGTAMFAHSVSGSTASQAGPAPPRNRPGRGCRHTSRGCDSLHSGRKALCNPPGKPGNREGKE